MLVSLEASSCVVCCTLSLYLNAACMLLAADDGFMSLSLKLFLNFKMDTLSDDQTATQNVWVFVFCGEVVAIAVALVKLQ